MRKLKTPEEICEEFPFEEPITPELLTKIIKSAQRDALECVKEDIEKQKDSRYR